MNVLLCVDNFWININKPTGKWKNMSFLYFQIIHFFFEMHKLNNYFGKRRRRLELLLVASPESNWFVESWRVVKSCSWDFEGNEDKFYSHKIRIIKHTCTVMNLTLFLILHLLLVGWHVGLQLHIWRHFNYVPASLFKIEMNIMNMITIFFQM